MRILGPPGVITGGDVHLNGRDVLAMDEDALRQIRWKEVAMVFQSAMNALNPVMTIGDQIVDTILATIFFWKSRSLPVFFVIPALVVIFVIEATFLAANGLKLAHGGYMPVLLGATIILLMVTWMRGRRALTDKLKKESVELVPLLESLERRQPTRVAGAAVFLQTDPLYAPSALMHNLKHNRATCPTVTSAATTRSAGGSGQ